MAVNLLIHNVTISPRISAAVFMSAKNGEIGMEFYRGEHGNKSAYLSKTGYENFIEEKYPLLVYFHAHLAKKESEYPKPPEFEKVLEHRRTGVSKLRVYSYLEFPYASIVYNRKIGNKGDEKLDYRPTGYQCIFNSEDILTFFHSAREKLDAIIEKMSKLTFVPTLYRVISCKVFDQALEIYN